LKRFRQQLAHRNVPTFNYLSFTNDHPRGTQPGYPTPTAMIADADLALGQLVSAISHSRIWSSSVIFVVEDDPMYDAFSPTPVNRAAVNTIQPHANLLARNGPSAPSARLSSGLPLGTPDAVPQRELDRIIWKSVYGISSAPTPPGPGATKDQ
jgi:hypothetical protein